MGAAPSSANGGYPLPRALRAGAGPSAAGPAMASPSPLPGQRQPAQQPQLAPQPEPGVPQLQPGVPQQQAPAGPAAPPQPQPGAPPDTVGVAELRDYRAYIHCGPHAALFFGRRVVLCVDAGACADLVAQCRAQLPALACVLGKLDTLLDQLDDVVGQRPPNPHGINGRVRCEVAMLPNAAGLAHHGRAGWAVGPAFLEQSLASHLRGPAQPGFIHQAFAYECMRNYIFPEQFTPCFDYRVVAHADPASRDCWGWVNQGFVNLAAILLVLEAGIPVDYHGQPGPQFCASMEAEVSRYQSSGLPWEAVFLRERLPWAEHRSLDNVYSGLLSILFWGRYAAGVPAIRGARFLRRWFRGALPLLLGSRCPASKDDWQTARDNFQLAACYAAGADLTPWFAGALRWPLSPAGAAALGTLLAAAACDPL